MFMSMVILIPHVCLQRVPALRRLMPVPVVVGAALYTDVGMLMSVSIHNGPFSQNWRLYPVSLMNSEMSPPPPHPTHLYLGTSKDTERHGCGQGGAIFTALHLLHPHPSLGGACSSWFQ